MGKKRTKQSKTDAANVGADGGPVGPGNPPKEYQFQPGESGNPKGQPKHRTHLWTHICRYMELTDAELTKLDLSKLTAAQQTALTFVEKAKAGENCGAERLMRYAVDRDNGQTCQNQVIHKFLTYFHSNDKQEIQRLQKQVQHLKAELSKKNRQNAPKRNKKA
jgi:hypothetical protein